MKAKFLAIVVSFLLCTTLTGQSAPQTAQPWLADRGTGVATSLFGTYVNKGELLVYPFLEFYLDDDYEYKPAELGYGLDQDFRGKYRATEALIFLAYGFTDRLAVEIEAAAITATLDKSGDDPSSQPASIEESGIGDIQAQLRYRWKYETASRPEIFGYYEVVLPHNKDKLLIGTSEIEHKLGAGAIKGFRFGTMTVRASVESVGDGLEPGEYAIEYLKRLTDRWRFFSGIEGTEDEVEWINEVQFKLRPNVQLKLNGAFGLTSKAPDFAPEIGVLFTF